MGPHRRHLQAASSAPWTRRLRLAAGLLLTAGWAAAASSVPALADLAPRPGDHTLLSWRDGPPYYTTARYSPDRRVLRLETGYFSAEIDTERATLTGFAVSPQPRDETQAAQAALAAVPLPASTLSLSVQSAEGTYVCVGRRPFSLDAHGMPSAPLEFPVRVIEGGRYFQKIAVHDLMFEDSRGRRLPAAARLEIAAWPDRLTLTLVLRPEKPLTAARAFLRLQSGSGHDASVRDDEASWPAGRDQAATLTLDAAGSARHPGPPDGIVVGVASGGGSPRSEVRWNAADACHEVKLISPPWPEVTEGIYPAAMLDAWETHDLLLENRSGSPQCVTLGFDYQPVKSITGFVPMLLDEGGQPTGFPIQISKNWHQVAEGVELPHAGPWMHGRSLVYLPAHSRRTLRHATTYARWGGVPSASLAQLSLVGWGHNGFWDQFALGSFGESLCFQPGRAMRRALLTDFRPLLQRGFAAGERQAWASNLGGSDTLVRLDPRGRYVPLRRNVTRYVSHGPNLARLDYEEASADDAIRSRVSVQLPRTDDVLRVYLKIRYDVLRRAEFSRLALFQLGAEYYNDCNAAALAWGDAGGLGQEHRPRLEPGARLVPPWPASGEDPWLSLHGETRADAERSGQGARALIVRHWQARLGGQNVAAPSFAAIGSRGPKVHLGAELTPPGHLTALEPGDYVDLLLELVAFPLNAERYYGPDRALSAALAADGNTWKMAHREAAQNRPRLVWADGRQDRAWPLTVTADATRGQTFSLAGGLGWIPLQITGLSRPDAVELHRVSGRLSERVVQGAPDRPFWQSDYDATRGQWTLTYNVPASAEPTFYRVVERASAAAPPVPAEEAAPAAR